MPSPPTETAILSPWWRRSVALVFIVGMAVLIYISVQAYRQAPPIPAQAVGPRGEVVFTRAEVEAGQQVFLKYGLMQNGSIWGHGSYLGPDFAARYLHELSLDTAAAVARQAFGRELDGLDASQRAAVEAQVALQLKPNRYAPETRTLAFTQAEQASFERQIGLWTDYFAHPNANGGLPSRYIRDPQEIRQLTAFFAWAAWASVANRPDKPYSYTNNFPFDPTVGNTLTSDAIGKPRHGVASDHLNHRLQAGDRVGVYLEANRRFRLPADRAAPLVLIAAGTGVAPYRAFLQQLEAEDRAPDSWLIFGDPRLRTDFLYQREWLRWRAGGLLTRIDAAWSRDQADKRYVQHVVAEQAADLADWLERGAHLYVCGGQAMGQAVERALEQCVAPRLIPEAAADPAAARDWLAGLRRQRRLSKDLY